MPCIIEVNTAIRTSWAVPIGLFANTQIAAKAIPKIPSMQGMYLSLILSAFLIPKPTK